jgi:hypothetical protein
VATAEEEDETEDETELDVPLDVDEAKVRRDELDVVEAKVRRDELDVVEASTTELDDDGTAELVPTSACLIAPTLLVPAAPIV